MKNIINKIYLLACLALAFTACDKDDRLMYEEAPEVYFYNGSSVVNPDSVEYTFVIKPDTLMRDTVLLNLRISGSASDKDRVVNLKLGEGSNAVKDKHFSFDPVIVKAGEYSVQVPVYLLRTEDMKNTLFKIYLEIGESEDFKIGFANRTSYLIKVTDQLIRPSDWAGIVELFYGKYSKVKHQFMVSRLGTTKITMSTGAQFSEIMSILQKMRVELIKYEAENGPLIDENGDVVTFPTL